MSPRRSRNHHEETNYLASTSDLMAGLLFIFIIALTYHMISFNEEQKKAAEAEARAKEAQQLALAAEADAKAAQQRALVAEAQAEETRQRAILAENEAEQARKRAVAAETKADQIQRRLAGNDMARSALLHRMQSELARENLQVSIDPSIGVLRLPEESITFETGKSALKPVYIERLQILKKALINELRCFHANSYKLAGCSDENPHSNILDAVFIEGHTDNQPFEGDVTGRRNRTLSTERANTVYNILLEKDSALHQYINSKEQNLFSLSGYGAQRPVPEHFHAQPTDDPVNRRIELRFIMSAPSLDEKDTLTYLKEEQN